jgi:hypothetical protein
MVIKYIRAFSLILAACAVIVHMIIPHDHHISGTLNGLKESCNLSHERSGHQPFFPAHCHAFNDLTAEKFTPVIIKQDSQTSFISVIWSTDSVISRLYFLQRVIEYSGKPYPDISVPDFSPFRAPPSAC